MKTKIFTEQPTKNNSGTVICPIESSNLVNYYKYTFETLFNDVLQNKYKDKYWLSDKIYSLTNEKIQCLSEKYSISQEEASIIMHKIAGNILEIIAEYYFIKCMDERFVDIGWWQEESNDEDIGIDGYVKDSRFSKNVPFLTAVQIKHRHGFDVSGKRTELNWGKDGLSKAYQLIDEINDQKRKDEGKNEEYLLFRDTGEWVIIFTDVECNYRVKDRKYYIIDCNILYKKLHNNVNFWESLCDEISC